MHWLFETEFLGKKEIRREKVKKTKNKTKRQLRRNHKHMKPKTEVKEKSQPGLQRENIGDRENENYSFNSLKI